MTDSVAENKPDAAVCAQCRDEEGFHTINCPCCNGLNEGQFWDLCDLCAAAALDGEYPHDCKRQETPND